MLFTTVCCILSLLCVCGVNFGANLLNFLVFDTGRTPVTMEEDILSSLIAKISYKIWYFITDFAREKLPKQIS